MVIKLTALLIFLTSVAFGGVDTIKDANNPNFLTVNPDGSINVGSTVTNFPATQACTQSGVWSVDRTWALSSSTDSVNVDNFPASFSVSNFPATQTVTGSVSVSNFPSSFSVSNFPASQTVNGSVSVSNFPTTQPVSGSVSVSNFPGTQAVSGPLTDTQLRATPVPVSGSFSVSPPARVKSTNNSFSNPTLSVSACQTGTIEGVLGYESASLVVTASQETFVDIYQYDSVGNIVSDEAYDVPASSGFRIDTRLYGPQLQVGVCNAGAGSANVVAETYLDHDANGFPSGVVDWSTLPNSFYARIRTQSDQLPTSLGQKTKAGSVSMTLASDQGALPVSGTFWQSTQPVSAASLPLPSGAAQEHVTAASPHAVRLTDGTSFYKATTPSDTQPVSIAATVAVSGPLTDTQLRASAVPVSVSGVATAANQTTQITSLQLLDDVPTARAGTFVQGSPAMGERDDTGTVLAGENEVHPVRITAARAMHTNLRRDDGTEIATSSTPLRVDPTGTTTQPVSGTVSANLNAGSNLVGKVGIDQTTNGTTNRVNIGTDGTVLANIGTTNGLALDATLTGGTAKMKIVDSLGVTPAVKLGNAAAVATDQALVVAVSPNNSVAVTGPLTDTQLRASAVPVSGTFFQSTQPVSLSSLPTLAAGSNLIGKVGIDQTTPGTTNKVSIGTDGTVAINAAIPSGANVIGKVSVDQTTDGTTNKVSAAQNGTWTVQPGNTANTTPWLASINDGTNTAKVQSASTTPAAADKALTVVLSPNGGNPCLNPAANIQTAAGSTSGTAATQIVALSGSTKIYVCSMYVTGTSGTTPTFSLVQGTGSNCGTGQTTLVGAWTTTANTLYAFNGQPVAVGTAGNALCYLQTGTTPVNRYTINYVQQ